ncbi:Pentatricopeptide repeat-containing protein [Abeliophyllum distichum]|uniref:Pentatricopeptide repeat-containing protein n=1 Tax=Abeliophyllum distichum TaxID=126358 RepID=A0ABD1NYI3_9LAMI
MPTYRAIFKRFQSFPKSLTIQSVNLSTTLTKPSKSFMGIAENFKCSTTFSGNYISVFSDHLKNQRLHEARALFDKISSPNVRVSTKMISCYVENCRLEEALKLFDKMPVRDTVMWNLMIKGCVDCGNLEMGLRLFNKMPVKNVISWTTVMNGLLKFGRVEEAEGLFQEMPVRDIAAWNAMIHGYFDNGRLEEAFKLFEVMPDRNVISWTSMISGLDQHGRNNEALSIFQKMVVLGMKPTSSTFACVITACANVGGLCLGSQVHGHVMKLGYVFDMYVIASLITLYANCKQMNNSFKVFDEKLHVNVVIWTSLLTGYGVNSKHEDALQVFGDMIRMGVIPNQSSFTSALNSCCEMEAVDWGKEIHGAAIKLGLERDVYVGNTLVLLYTACGNISNGVSVFNEIAEKNIVSWNTIIVGCAQHGYGKGGTNTLQPNGKSKS